MTKHDFKQHIDLSTGYIILQNSVDNDYPPFLRSKVQSGSPHSPYSSNYGTMSNMVGMNSMSPLSTISMNNLNMNSLNSMNSMGSVNNMNNVNNIHLNSMNGSAMGNVTNINTLNQTVLNHSSQISSPLSNHSPILNSHTMNSPSMVNSPVSTLDRSIPINHYKKIHFLPTRRGAQLKLFHNMNFFRTDKHFQLAIQFSRDVDIRFITFQWEYCTENGWEKFTSDVNSLPTSKNQMRTDSTPSSTQGQKPFVLIHKLNVDKMWLKMELQFPIGSIALKGKQVKWKSLNGGKMFRVVITTYLSVEGSSSYEMQRVWVPYVIDNKRSKENEKIDRIHAHFKEIETGNKEKTMILDEEASSNASKLHFESHARRVMYNEVEFLKLISPPYLVMSNHVLTEVANRSSRDTSPMSSVSSPGSSYSNIQIKEEQTTAKYQEYTNNTANNVREESYFQNQNRIFQHPQFQQEYQNLQEMLRQHNESKQNVMPFHFTNMQDTEPILEDNNLDALGSDMDLNFIDEFEQSNFNKVNHAALNFHNVPQIKDVPEMPQKKRKRSNSSHDFLSHSSYDLELDQLEKAILDFAPIDTHAPVSLLGSFRDCTLGSEELNVYFGYDKGTVLNVTPTCISVLTPKVNQPSEVTITVEKSLHTIPKPLTFRFVADYNSEVSRLASRNIISAFGNSSHKNDLQSFYDDNRLMNDSYIHPHNQWANSVNPCGQTLLHIFSDKGLPDYVYTCLRIGIPPTKRDNMYRTPLHMAAAKGHILTAKILLKCAGLNLLTWMDAFEETPLDLALRFQHYDFIEFLFKWIHVNFLPSKVLILKERFSYIFSACQFVKLIQKSHQVKLSKLLGLFESNHSSREGIYITKISQQDQLLKDMMRQIESLSKENKYLQETQAVSLAKGSHKTQSVNSQPVKSIDEAALSDALSKLKIKSLQCESDMYLEQLQKRNIEVKELKQKLVLSQLKNQQYELEIVHLMKNNNDILSQMKIMKTKTRKYSFLNVVSHTESDNILGDSDSTETPSIRLKKVNENAWKQYLAKHNEANPEIMQEVHFSVTEVPIFHKLLSSIRKNGMREDTKAIRKLIPQYENADIIKENIFGKSHDQPMEAYLCLSPFCDHKKERLPFNTSTAVQGFSSIHTSVLVNNCVLEWQEDSLVNLRKLTEKQKGQFVIFGINPAKISPSKQDAIVQQIVTWNRTKEYNSSERNCQHFVDTIMSIIYDLPLGSKDWLKGPKDLWHLSKYIEDVRNDATLAIPHTYIRSVGEINDAIRINFYTLTDIEEYMRECCGDMKLDEVYLLHTFDSIFHALGDFGGEQVKESSKSSGSPTKNQTGDAKNMRHESHLCPLDVYQQVHGILPPPFVGKTIPSRLQTNYSNDLQDSQEITS